MIAFLGYAIAVFCAAFLWNSPIWILYMTLAYLGINAFCFWAFGGFLK